MQQNGLNLITSNFISMYQSQEENNFPLERRKSIESFSKSITKNSNNMAILSYFIVKALQIRETGGNRRSKNIYLEEFDTSQISLFDKLIYTYPHVRASYAIINSYMLKVIAKLEKVTICEIGIGRGKQLLELISSVTKLKKRPSTMHIIGIDPDKRNLIESANNILKFNKESDIQFKFSPICKVAEKLLASDFQIIKNAGKGNLLVNSAYCLHHTMSTSKKDIRARIFEKIFALQPRLFTLIEPNANHNSDDIGERLINCWNHYLSVFDLIDLSEASKKLKFSIKCNFFGREIIDILGVPDSFRTERHETIDTWLQRLMKSGFTLCSEKKSIPELDKNCNVSLKKGVFELEFRNKALIGVFVCKAGSQGAVTN